MLNNFIPRKMSEYYQLIYKNAIFIGKSKKECRGKLKEYVERTEIAKENRMETA